MATVTVVTAERTLEIEATSIVDGEINAAGHLILTRHDGTPLDMGAVSGVQLDSGTTYAKADVFSYVGDTDPGAVPDGSVWFDTTGPAGPFASETQQGLVELATDAEVIAGVDTQRAVTPAGFAAAYAAIPGSKVQILAPNANTETAVPSAYPLGLSLMALTTGSGWSINSGFGSVMTQRAETDRTVQTAYSNPGGTGTPRQWQRQYHTSNNGGGWTAWSQVQMTYTLTPGTLVQTSAFTSYPTGWSRMYFSTANGTGWDFAGSAGELMTFVDGSDFAKQTFISHGHTSSTAPGVWARTASAANGWTAWAKQIPDTGSWFSYTPTWTTTSGNNVPTLGNASVNCKYVKHGRLVTVKFDIVFGSTTNFGGGGGTDNWRFGLPVTAADTTSTLGFVELVDSSANTTAAGMGMGRAKMSTSSGFAISVTAGSPTDWSTDVDSTQPWNWASGDAVRGILTFESAS